jgi:beta-glucanase (GH16 family)
MAPVLFGQDAAMLMMFASSGMGASAGAPVDQHHCVVPTVKRESLVTAESRLRASLCAPGRITGPRNGLVKVETPTPGTRERIGTKVSLALAHTRKATPVLATATTATTLQVQPAGVQPVGIPGNWNLVLDTEFDGSSLDTSVWRTGWFGSGVTTPASNTDDDCYSPSNVSFPGDGTMHLDVTATSSTCGGVTYPYTGAMVTTNPNDGRGSGGFQYTYGVLEARVYVPAAGTVIADWPAVWADGQSWPTDGEDDVMEGLDGSACATFHDPLDVGIRTRACSTTVGPGWHTFASNWEPGSITYYYDGAAIATVTSGVTSAPMYLLLTNTVKMGEPNVTEPASMQVQYVRVWQQN